MSYNETSRYTSERNAFNHFKKNCKPEVVAEYVEAINTVLGLYNTSIHENRFVTGGAVEFFTCAMLRSVGLDCKHYAAQEHSGDLLLPNGKLFSVKGTFTGGVTNIKLINQLGSGIRTWNTATLFIVSNVGIVYGDPSMAEESDIRLVADGVELKKQGLQRFVDNPENVFRMDFPVKPPKEETGFSRKASTAVAKQILHDKGLKLLLDSSDSL